MGANEGSGAINKARACPRMRNAAEGLIKPTSGGMQDAGLSRGKVQCDGAQERWGKAPPPPPPILGWKDGFNDPGVVLGLVAESSSAWSDGLGSK